MRVLSLFVAVFIFLSVVSAWAGFWLAGRWYVSSRYATLSLATVKSWLDRGIINRGTQQVKVFINKHGKWILLTLALSEVIREVESLSSSSQVCYIPAPHRPPIYAGWTSWGTLSTDGRGIEPQNYFTVSYSRTCNSGGANLPVVEIRRWQRYEWVYEAEIPAPGTYMIGQCQVTYSLRNVGGVCPSDVTQAPSEVDEVDLSQRRRVPVKVFPRVEDFVRPDVVSADASLRWLRDEYQRIASDSSIPTIPSDALGDLELPSVDWSISPDEALREGEGAREGDISVPGLDTDLSIPKRRSFSVELINSVVQSHPLLRVLQAVSVDASGVGSCSIGSDPFRVDFCQWQWVLNAMGGLIVFVAFMTGLIWSRGE